MNCQTKSAFVIKQDPESSQTKSTKIKQSWVCRTFTLTDHHEKIYSHKIFGMAYFLTDERTNQDRQDMQNIGQGVKSVIKNGVLCLQSSYSILPLIHCVHRRFEIEFMKGLSFLPKRNK